MLAFTTDQWIIVLLVFVLGLLVGGFLFSGGGRRWKARYNSELDRRVELEKRHAAAEKEWRERDSLRGAALKGDRNRDGVPDREQPVGTVDRDGDGIDDRRQV
jgi:hypothetical protein